MLLTAGCSYVWGDELEGFDNDPPTHGHLTFTHLLAEKLGLDYRNLGMCGSCNDRIFRDVIDHLHNPSKPNPTHIVIMWSAWQRTELVEEMTRTRELDVAVNRPLHHTQFSPKRVNVLAKGIRREMLKHYYELAYDSKTDISHGISKMKSMEVICDALGIKLIQGAFHGRMYQNILKVMRNQSSIPGPMGVDGRLVEEYVPDFVHWLKASLNSLKDTSRVGLGKHKDLHSIAEELGDLKEFGHPGERTQVVFADFLFDKFNKLN